MSRISLKDTGVTVIIKMCEGNLGAISVCRQLLSDTPKIDPDSFMGGVGIILSLDTLAIYGSRIWMLYKDVCGQNIHDTLAVLRGVQLGFISQATLNYAIDHYGEGISVKDLVKQVKERLPKFGGENAK